MIAWSLDLSTWLFQGKKYLVLLEGCIRLLDYGNMIFIVYNLGTIKDGWEEKTPILIHSSLTGHTQQNNNS